MRLIKKNKMVKFLIAILCVIILSLVLANSLGLASNQWSSFWPPTPPDLHPTSNNTPTPNQTEISINSTINSNCCPTSTPMVISKTIDLSPNLPDNEKYEVYVAHANGIVDKYLIGPLRSLDNPMDIWPIPPELITDLNLTPGDTILFTSAIIFEKNWPMILTATPSLTNNPSTIPVP